MRNELPPRDSDNWTVLCICSLAMENLAEIPRFGKAIDIKISVNSISMFLS